MYFWGLVKKVVQQVEDLSFFLLFLLFYKKVKKSEKKYKKVFSTFPDNYASCIVLSVTTTSYWTTHSYFSICLLISHPIITKFYTHHLVVSVNIFHTFLNKNHAVL